MEEKSGLLSNSSSTNISPTQILPSGLKILSTSNDLHQESKEK